MNKSSINSIRSSDCIIPIENASISSNALHFIIQELLEKGQPISITVTGSSMQPFLRNGKDRVLIAPADLKKINRGDILLYKRENGQFVLHRVHSLQEKSFTMIGDAQWILEKGVAHDQVLGKAILALRKGKKVSCEHGYHHLKMKVYLCRMSAPRFFHWLVACKSKLKAVIKKIIHPYIHIYCI